MENIVIREYIESLNESGELDYIFPMLLESMGFRLITTPVCSKGQSQYGKDVVAIRKENGKYYKYYFELKGFFDKNINDSTFLKPDGFRESILAARYTAFNDASIPRLNDLPVKIVYVHNGKLIENTRNTFDGFIKQEFPENNFERWDIFKLTEVFSKYLFNEYLLTDSENVRLFKRTLVLLDAPDNDYSDLKQIVEKLFIQLKDVKITSSGGKRKLLNLFASLKLLIAIVYKYAKENNNLHPAKECVNYVVLKTWSWILENKLEQKNKIIENFNGLILVQIDIYSAYFSKTVHLAQVPKGLYSFAPIQAETICYPLRCFDYLNDLIYYFSMINAYLDKKRRTVAIVEQKKLLKEIVEANSGCTTILLDNHSITIHLVLGFILKNFPDESDEHFCIEYIYKLVLNLILTYNTKKRLPELYSNRIELAKSCYTKTDVYCDKSSLLLLFLFELIAFIDAEDIYIQLREVVENSGVNLQVAYPRDDFDIEQLLFEKTLQKEISVETSIKLPATLAEFKKEFKKRYNSIMYRTDQTGYGFLRLLAHFYFKTDFFPDYLNLGFYVPMSKK